MMILDLKSKGLLCHSSSPSSSSSSPLPSSPSSPSSLSSSPVCFPYLSPPLSSPTTTTTTTRRYQHIRDLFIPVYLTITTTAIITTTTPPNPPFIPGLLLLSPRSSFCSSSLSLSVEPHIILSFLEIESLRRRERGTKLPLTTPSNHPHLNTPLLSSPPSASSWPGLGAGRAERSLGAARCVCGDLMGWPTQTTTMDKHSRGAQYQTGHRSAQGFMPPNSNLTAEPTHTRCILRRGGPFRLESRGGDTGSTRSAWS
ncbi:hypothetical protein E2C01_047342 [Portunus trituberculatus]|uniref:Uncharacterized protein n=1 Tax=Portunus trituberculatus TaxID=210409 RepID=A0A5B7G068_PORTR|nr:hypothetical protein [Portunus trituberculatus]